MQRTTRRPFERSGFRMMAIAVAIYAGACSRSAIRLDVEGDVGTPEPDAADPSTPGLICTEWFCHDSIFLESDPECPETTPPRGEACAPLSGECFYCVGPESTWRDQALRDLYRCVDGRWEKTAAACGLDPTPRRAHREGAAGAFSEGG